MTGLQATLYQLLSDIYSTSLVLFSLAPAEISLNSFFSVARETCKQSPSSHNDRVTSSVLGNPQASALLKQWGSCRENHLPGHGAIKTHQMLAKQYGIRIWTITAAQLCQYTDKKSEVMPDGFLIQKIIFSSGHDSLF